MLQFSESIKKLPYLSEFHLELVHRGLDQHPENIQYLTNILKNQLKLGKINLILRKNNLVNIPLKDIEDLFL